MAAAGPDPPGDPGPAAVPTLDPTELRIRTLEVWIAEASPGDRMVYHRGSLAIDRAADEALDQMAAGVYHLSNAEAIPVLTSCRHLARYEQGSNLLRLVAVAITADRSVWEYLAEKI